MRIPPLKKQCGGEGGYLASKFFAQLEERREGNGFCLEARFGGYAPLFPFPFLSAAKPSDLGTLRVLLFLVVVGGGTLLELTHVQFFRGVFKSYQICFYPLKTQVTF